ncbi:MAG TPA: HAD-IC family P-type ATPase, partial [Bacteroidales bacterium]|nr:HAD-IC family P-type ATPase [Bacteroidales bacterium]
MNQNSRSIRNVHAKEVREVTDLLESSTSGLSPEEHKHRLMQYGPNKLKKQKQKSIWEILLSQVNNPVVYLLVAAVTVSLIFGDIPESIAIAVVILLNTVIGFWMELQARQSMESLHKIDRISADVMLDGNRQDIDAEELVPGDVLNLEAGDLVPADARVFEASELKIDESPLTGESVPVEKTTDTLEEDTPVADRLNMVFKGTSVTGGKGKALVSGTGMQTEIGNISEMVSNASDENIPLNKKLKNLTKSLIWVITVMAGLFFLVGWLAGKDLYLMLQTAIAWTIAAIPEGLPIVASIALARGMLRLSKQHVLVKKLAAVETLGEVTMIFTDKTGTLTENKLSLQTLLIPEEGEFQIS